MALQDDYASLAPLESFDPSVFQSDLEASEALCQFILALALIYNDSKDTVVALVRLREARPEGEPKVSRDWGAHAGIEGHLIRGFVSILHELFDLIRENQDLLKNPVLVEIIRLLSGNTRQNWNELVTVALGATPKTELGRILMLVRNKVSSHYDLKCLKMGYTEWFFGKDKKHDRAYLSRGENMVKSSFYFADAAAQGYLAKVIGDKDFDGFLKNSAEIFGQLNVSLNSVIDKFIQKRSSYRLVE